MAKIQVNDIEMYYEVHGSGEPLLLIMGTGGDTNHWALQLPYLVKHYQMILFDNRGVGQTSQPEAAYTTEQMADDCAGLMQAIGLDSAHVLGYSLGGFIAQYLSVKYPERVRSLILSNTATMMTARSKMVGESLLKLVDANAPAAVRQFVFLPWIFTSRFMEDTKKMNRIIERLDQKSTPQTSAGYIGQVHAVLNHDAHDILNLIRQPTLCLAGDQDLITPPACAQEMAEIIPTSEIQILQNMGHCGYIEDPVQYNNAVLGFLSNN